MPDTPNDRRKKKRIRGSFRLRVQGEARDNNQEIFAVTDNGGSREPHRVVAPVKTDVSKNRLPTYWFTRNSL
jgi:hypothetical protein